MPRWPGDALLKRRGIEHKKSEEEGLFQEEDINEKVFHLRKSGKSINPPDEFLPERGKKNRS